MRARPFVVDHFWWGVLTATWILASILSAGLGGLRGFSATMAVFTPICILLANGSEEMRQPTADEAAVLLEAAALSGRDPEFVVRLPRPARLWRRKLLQASAAFTLFVMLAFFDVGI